MTKGWRYGKGYYVRGLREFGKRFRRKRPALIKWGPWHFHQDNSPVYNSILVIDYLTEIDFKTVPHPPYSRYLARRYETIEQMKEVVMKVTDTLTQEDVNGTFQKLLERYNNFIAAGGDYFEED